jgi:hypothetical protein
VFIKWDMSPFVIQYRETGRSFAHFLTRLCAITGGTFVVLGTPPPPPQKPACLLRSTGPACLLLPTPPHPTPLHSLPGHASNDPMCRADL